MDLLERLKINSLEIDLIKNGTPLKKVMSNSVSGLGKKTAKFDLEELQKLAKQSISEQYLEKEPIIVH